MANDDLYTNQQNSRIRQKIEDILVELPKCSMEYIYSKMSAEKFQPRTRLAYLEEQLLFFKYLCNSHEDFMDFKPADIPAELLNKLTTQDIEAYLAYCGEYIGENGPRQNNAPGKARKLAAIRSLFRYLVGRRILSINVAANVDTPSIPNHDVVFMNSDQQGTFLDNLQEGKHVNAKKDKAEYDEKNIIHIHGRVAQHYYGIPLEVGHNNRNFSRPLLKATYKKVDEISKKLEKTICELAEKNEITDIKIVGHSFNDIDFLYFCIINEKFKEANWTFGCKTGRDFENAQQYAHRLGLDTKKYIIINSEQVFETKEM